MNFLDGLVNTAKEFLDRDIQVEKLSNGYEIRIKEWGATERVAISGQDLLDLLNFLVTCDQNKTVHLTVGYEDGAHQFKLAPWAFQKLCKDVSNKVIQL